MTRRASWLILALVVAAILGPWLAPYDPGRAYRGFLFAPPMPPRLVGPAGLQAPFVYPIRLVSRLDQRYEEDRSRTVPLPALVSANTGGTPVFLLGADSFGRDVLSRLLAGARVSIGVAIAATVGALFLGALIGVWAGYRGGWIDELLMRAADFVLVLPVLYVVLVLRAVMPLVLPASTIFLLMAAIFALVGWPVVARGVRAIIRAERAREYIAAAQSLGASPARIVFRHLLPSCGGHLVVQATLLLPAFILAEATLSYVGLGFPDETASWGTMLIEASNVNALARFPWTLAPAAAIFAVALATNLLLERSAIKLSRS
ncbi:MAG: ABC transporter permease [Acidobacteriota bacterium]